MEIRYAQSDDVSLAYALEGESGLPLIFIPGIVSNLAIDESNPLLARFYERMGRFSRFVRWDRRGTGLSDQSADPLPLAEQARDLEAIRRAVGFERFALIGFSHGTALAARYAAAEPRAREPSGADRGRGLRRARPGRRRRRRRSHPWDALESRRPTTSRPTPRGWSAAGAPSAEPGAARAAANMIKASVTRAGCASCSRRCASSTCASCLREIRVPTLVAPPERRSLCSRSSTGASSARGSRERATWSSTPTPTSSSSTRRSRR